MATLERQLPDTYVPPRNGRTRRLLRWRASEETLRVAVIWAASRVSVFVLATYSTWIPKTAEIEPGTTELEFYDYGIPEGEAEMVSHPDDPRAREMRDKLLHDLIPNELRERLPGTLGAAQELSKRAYIFVQDLYLDPNSGESVRDMLRQLGYGREF